MSSFHNRNQASPLPQNVQKKKSKAEEQDDVCKKEKKSKKRIRTGGKTVQSVNKTKIKSAQRKDLRELNSNLEERYFINAAVLPKFRPRPASYAVAALGMRTTSKSLMEQPLMIHGLSVPEYQSVYHSVVDPRLVTSTGQPRYYSRELGRRIKQRLWKTLKCPSFKKEEQVHGNKQVHYAEKFSAPTQKSFAPRFDLDISYEPKPMAWTLVSDVQKQLSASASSRTDNKTVKNAKKRKTKAAQENELRRLGPHLDECYIVNDEAIPKFRLQPVSFATAAPGIGSAGESVMAQPFMFHDLNVPEYQSVHQSVVDSELGTSTRQSRRYSMELGRRIKQRLWEPLNCSSEQYYAEKFRAPIRNSFTPRINTDINFEPKPMVRMPDSDLQQQSSSSAATRADDKMIPIVKKRKTKAAQKGKLWKLEPPLEEHCMVSNVAPPEFHPRSASCSVAASGTCSTSKLQMKQPPMVHDLWVPEHQSVHQSVVDPESVKSTGQPCCYSMELGHRIKQRLWKPLNCSSVIKTEQIHSSDQDHDVEKFSTPTRKSFAPKIDVDISHKPMPMVQTAAERKIEAAQEKDLQNLEPNLEERYIINAAVLPEFRPRHASFAVAAPGTCSISESLIEQPLMIHGLSVPEYLIIHHSVVDPKLVTSTEEPHCYSTKQGRRIKQRLWKMLNRPFFLEEGQVQSDEQVHYAEKFNAPTQKNFARQINVKIKYEPESTVRTLVSDLQQQSSASAFSRTVDKLVQMRKNKMEGKQMEELRRLEPHLEERYTVNTAVLPEMCPRSVSFADSSPDKSSASKSLIKQPIVIHGPSNSKYQSVQQSVVVLEHMASTGQPHCHSMKLGCRIKKHLWEPLSCTFVKEEEQKHGDVQVHYAKNFSSSTWKSFDPQINAGNSHETMPTIAQKEMGMKVSAQSELVESTFAATSTDVYIAQKEKTEAAQEKQLQKLKPNLQERYIVNAAVLPEFRPRPASFAVAAPGTSSDSESLMEQPLMIHGLSVSEYQTVYHSGVNPKLMTSTEEPQCYSRKLGRKIKQHLWKIINRPSFLEEEQIHGDEQVHYSEKFSAPKQKCFAPQINMKISYKPKPMVRTLVSDLRDHLSASAITRRDDKTISVRESLMSQPLMNHDPNIPEYQSVQLGVNPEPVTSTGQPRCYSMEQSRRIRKHLWKPLNCTSVMEGKQLNSHAHHFNTTTQKSFAPQIPVDINHKTMPKVQIANKRKVKTAQEKDLQRLEPHLKEHYIANAAVLPELHPRPASLDTAAPGMSTTSKALMVQPLMINDLRVPMCQNVHYSVVDPELMTSTGQPSGYSMELGRRIKQRLWEPLNCSSVIEKEQIHNSEQVHFADKFSAQTRKSVPSQIYVNILRKTMPMKENRTKNTAVCKLVESTADLPSTSSATSTNLKMRQ